MTTIEVSLGDLARVVRSELNGRQWRLPFISTISYKPEWTQAQLSTLRVTIMPKNETQERLTRARSRSLFDIDIGIQKKVSQSTRESEIDEILELRRQISNHFNGVRLGYYYAREVTGQAAFLPDHLSELNVFTSIISLNVVEMILP